MGRTNKQLDPTLTGTEAVKLDADLRRRIVGQDEAVDQIVNIYQTFLAGMSGPGRPIGNFLFLGPTGSGKTRLVEATASSYVVSPAAMGPAASDPGRSRDRLSAGYLIALAARVVREVSELATRARETGKRLATLSIDTEIRFRSAAERAQFSSELTAAITQLAARYHDASALGGRTHRLVLVAHPLPQKNKETAI